MEYEQSTDDLVVTEEQNEEVQVSVASEVDAPSEPSVDDLEIRLEAVESAMQQLQAGDISAAEEALVILDGSSS